MQPSYILSAVAAVFSLASMAHATPLPCPDAKIDLILNGKLAPDACCGGGICKGDILSKFRSK